MISKKWLSLAAIVTAVVLSNGTSAFADEGKGSPKGKGDKKSDIIQLDLSKLPPELAKQLKQYSAQGDKAVPQPKYKAPEKTTARPLPPGLAKKPVEHPGRVAFLKNAGQTPDPTDPPKGKDKGKGKGSEERTGDDR